MRLDELTWVEVGEYLERRRGIIIPVGTCEQHGKHLPLNTDTIVAEHIADFLSEETGIIVAPTINHGVNLPCDRFYSGTCSLSESVLSQLLGTIIDWWEIQGFSSFYVVTAHGDPFHIRALRDSGRDSLHLLELYDLQLEDILDGQRSARHAGEAETSVMLYLCPDRVREDMIEDFETPFDEFRGYLEHTKTTPIENSPGCQGVPSAASREKGQAIISRMKERALRWIRGSQVDWDRSRMGREEDNGQATGG